MPRGGSEDSPTVWSMSDAVRESFKREMPPTERGPSKRERPLKERDPQERECPERERLPPHQASQVN